MTLDLPAPLHPIFTRLEELHRRVSRTMQEATLCGAIAGLVLAPYRAVLDSGEWTDWVGRNCPFTPRSALNYLRAGERATAALAAQLGRPVEAAEVIAQLERALDSHDEAMIGELLEAIRKPKPALPPGEPAAPKPPRAPRTPPPPAKVASRYAVRVLTQPEPVRHLIFTELRAEFTAWLQTHQPAA